MNISSPEKLVFVSYCSADDYWLERLTIHLGPLARNDQADIWADTRIHAGDDWRQEIDAALEACKVAILLVTADFMASDFITRVELPSLLASARGRGVRIIPVIVSSSSFEFSELARFQALNSPRRPLDMLSRGEQENELSKLYGIVVHALKKAGGDPNSALY